MTEFALSFTSVSDLCAFIRTIHLQNFVLLGKKSVLIAPFSDEAISLALSNFHARLVEAPDLYHQKSERSLQHLRTAFV